jgi:hypothetical protein
MMFTRIKPELKCGAVSHKLQAVSNCWICEGWSEVKFAITPKENVDVADCPVTLHLSCDEFRPELILPKD